MAQLKMGFKGLKPVDFAMRTKTILQKMEGNAHFPNPEPPLSEVADKLLQFTQIIHEASRGDRDKIAHKHRLHKELCQVMTTLAGYVAATAAGDERIILSSGFSVRQNTNTPIEVKAPKWLKAIRGSKTGEVHLRWSAVHGSKCYIIEQNTSDPTVLENWAILDVSPVSGITIKGLKPASYYWFRVRALGSRNKSGYSNVLHYMAS